MEAASPDAISLNTAYAGNDVIYDVVLTTGKTYRGRFYPNGHLNTPFVTLDLYVPDESKPEQSIDLNPACIVSVQVWLV